MAGELRLLSLPDAIERIENSDLSFTHIAIARFGTIERTVVRTRAKRLPGSILSGIAGQDQAKVTAWPGSDDILRQFVSFGDLLVLD
ncbi:putative YcjX-like family ATPase [Nitrobacteraceae bacterium AZCC 2146]